MKLLLLALIASLTLVAGGEYSNRRAPGFSLADSKFQQHDPQDYRGKVLVVEFMQTTCEICLRLTQSLVQVEQKYGDKIGILSITTLPDNYQKGDQYARDHHLTWPILFDSGQVMMSYLKVTPASPTVHFPHLFIIDKNGTIRDDYEGAVAIPQISADIDKLLK